VVKHDCVLHAAFDLEAAKHIDVIKGAVTALGAEMSASLLIALVSTSSRQRRFSWVGQSQTVDSPPAAQ
jgi:hypothetical protein